MALAQTKSRIKQTKSLFDLGCATLCADHTGDPVDVSGVDFADLVSLYLDGSDFNITDGNFTDTIDGNFTEIENDAALIYGNIDCWDVSAVTDMSGAFAFQDEFNSRIECWDVSSVSDMSSMFFEASSFNQNLNIWGAIVPRNGVITTDMFKGSSCEVESDPDTIGRPWCQFDQPKYSPQFECFFFKKCDNQENFGFNKPSGDLFNKPSGDKNFFS
eukprot:CAMPEP_0197183260 /NCGR_PEP_ID=MMETSP1423-20130617/7721_1 /TAXON_ID=476441 /ORGANISM="Pseudo-nitzschia heimii, Strain UNC1101" /LENGTH=215 /DNA_ID=CAMNT_0042633821 /DNA_START=124 /DNA_END=771 /DNA_ORIENTATION=+